jgi:hypothetical protein
MMYEDKLRINYADMDNISYEVICDIAKCCKVGSADTIASVDWTVLRKQSEWTTISGLVSYRIDRMPVY